MVFVRHTLPGETVDAVLGRADHTLAIFLVSLAGLLLEVGYTRIVSYKLWYYYTYLVIGLALLSLVFLVEGDIRWWGLVGAILVGTGFIGWCPAYLPFGINTCKKA